MILWGLDETELVDTCGVGHARGLGDSPLVLAIMDNDYLNRQVIRLDGAVRMAPR